MKLKPVAENRYAKGRPWDGRNRKNLPGYWLLASLGKRVLRPGGIQLTRQMIEALDIGPEDRVIEYAPGMGVTAELTLQRNPQHYMAIERDPAATAMLNQLLAGKPNRQCVCADATEPVNLPDGFATVVYGESMLTIHSDRDKVRILSEVHRLLKPGGRYGFQEISLNPENTPEALADQIRRDLVRVVRHPARPKTTRQWRDMVESQGFEITLEASRPVRLLELDRLLEDEGPQGALEFTWNVLQDPIACQRIREIRNVFERYAGHLCGNCLVLRKPN